MTPFFLAGATVQFCYRDSDGLSGLRIGGLALNGPVGENDLGNRRLGAAGPRLNGLVSGEGASAASDRTVTAEMGSVTAGKNDGILETGGVQADVKEPDVGKKEAIARMCAADSLS